MFNLWCMGSKTILSLPCISIQAISGRQAHWTMSTNVVQWMLLTVNSKTQVLLWSHIWITASYAQLYIYNTTFYVCIALSDHISFLNVPKMHVSFLKSLWILGVKKIVGTLSLHGGDRGFIHPPYLCWDEVHVSISTQKDNELSIWRHT